MYKTWSLCIVPPHKCLIVVKMTNLEVKMSKRVLSSSYLQQQHRNDPLQLPVEVVPAVRICWASQFNHMHHTEMTSLIGTRKPRFSALSCTIRAESFSFQATTPQIQVQKLPFPEQSCADLHPFMFSIFTAHTARVNQFRLMQMDLPLVASIKLSQIGNQMDVKQIQCSLAQQT